MKLLATMGIAYFLVALGIVVGQTRGPSASDAPQIAGSQSTPTIQATRSGSHGPAKNADEHFTGSASIDRLFAENPQWHTFGASVTFGPGARTDWHSHPLSQTLIVTAGRGWVQQWRGQAQEVRQGDQEIRQGDIVWIPPGIKHWHGASASTSMTHIGTQESLEGKTVEWMEKVSDEQYGNLPSTPGGVMASTKEPSAAQKLMGDFDRKLAELTDNVLFGDVSERPGLSKRDRTLITVASLIALNRPEQLRHHLQRARENGVSKDEVVEIITHLAFYAGWPNAINAVAIAREVYQ
jgi:4-carboxymuconolactone decarboxylase